MNNLAIKGREHSGASDVKVTIKGDQAEAVATRHMHLNPPLINAEIKRRKKTSWHNIAAQETRAEAINMIVWKIGRQLTWDEIDTMQTIQTHTEHGVTSRVNVVLDKEPTSE